MKGSQHTRPRLIGRLALGLGIVFSLAQGAAAQGDGNEDAADLLRFLNGDSLHGTFLGLKDSQLRWRHEEALETIPLKTDKLRRIAFNGGKADKLLRSPSYVLLQNGDRIPGTITRMDAEMLTIETEFAGVVTIPRGAIRQIAPNPHGGAVHYIGPFSAEEWTIVEPPQSEEPEEKEEDDEAKNADRDEGEDDEEVREEAPWVFSGGAYYSNSQIPIAVDTKAPRKARFQFRLAWRNRLNTAIAFHATMEQPPRAEDEKEDGDKEEKADRPPVRLAARDSGNVEFALTYGASYVLTIYSNYAQLYRCSFNEEGEPQMSRLASSSSNLRLEESGDAEFELRCDGDDGTVTLFSDGRYVSQWQDDLGYAGIGTHLAFACQSSSSRLRVSDVVVSSWNGMIDSAQSMETDERDVVLLVNGTDRFSGEVLELEDGKFRIQGSYAELVIPQEDVQEIRTARFRRNTEDDEKVSRQSVRLLFQPLGRLTMQPQESTAERFNGFHSELGELTLDLRYSGLMEFSFGQSVLDSWDEDY